MQSAQAQSVTVDPSIVPFSHRGSFLCLATKSGERGRLTPAKDVYLVTHIWPAGLPLFALRSHANGPLPPPSGFHTTSSGVDVRGTPSLLTWTHDGAKVAEATFLDVRAIRIRGTAPFSLDTEGNLDVPAWRTWIFRVPSATATSHDIAEFTSTPDAALRIVALQGKLDLINDAPSTNNNRRITISPKEGQQEWELLIVERERPPAGPRHLSGPSIDFFIKRAQVEDFPATERRVAASMSQYVRELCWWSSPSFPITTTDAYAAFVMWTSTVRPSGYFLRETVLMSKLWMNKMWSWDNVTCNSLALVGASIELALDQMLAPFDYITSEGRLPDSICHSEILFDYTKPPIYGWAVFKLFSLLSACHHTPEPMKLFSNDQLVRLYEGVSKFTEFWYVYRLTAVSAIPWYSHGNDSGWDNSTGYDRQTTCCSPDLAAFLIVQNDMLAILADFLGRKDEAAMWTQKKKEMTDALINELWDSSANCFTFKDAYTGERWTSPTLLKYIPLVAAAYLPSSIVDAMAAGVRSHLTEYGLATEEPSSSLYEPDGYWRGPIWAPPTVIIESGLRRAGHTQLADEISNRFVRLCEKTGFAENYDALTGAGNRDLSYTWSASTYLVLRAESAVRSQRSQQRAA